MERPLPTRDSLEEVRTCLPQAGFIPVRGHPQQWRSFLCALCGESNSLGYWLDRLVGRAFRHDISAKQRTGALAPEVYFLLRRWRTAFQNTPTASGPKRHLIESRQLGRGAEFIPVRGHPPLAQHFVERHPRRHRYIQRRTPPSVAEEKQIPRLSTAGRLRSE